MRAHVQNAGLEMRVDSAGTGSWHVGHAPDPGSLAAAAAADVDISRQRARQVTPSDFCQFDYIVALDRDNLADLKAMEPQGATAKLVLLLDHHPDESRADVPDPYGGDARAFAEVWDLVHRATHQLLVDIRK